MDQRSISQIERDWQDSPRWRGVQRGYGAKDVARLRDDHGIYAVDSGRICVAALNSSNVARIGAAVAARLNA